MKIKIFFITICAALLFFPAYGQESQPSQEYPLTITIIGAASYNDVRFLQTNLKRSAQISGLTPTLSSRGLSEFSGNYRGPVESLIDEIKGLAQDRFAVETPKQKGRQSSNTLSVTLRKLTSEGTPN